MLVLFSCIRFHPIITCCPNENAIFWKLGASNPYWSLCAKSTSNKIRVNKSLLVEGVRMRENWELFLSPNYRIIVRSFLSFYQGRNFLDFFCSFYIQSGFLWLANPIELFTIVLVGRVPVIFKKFLNYVLFTLSPHSL